MAEDAANAFAGDNGYRLLAILGRDDFTDLQISELSEHFGDSSQWMDNLFEVTFHDDSDMMYAGHPLIDGEMAYAHEGLKKWVDENQWVKDKIESVKSKDLAYSPYKDSKHKRQREFSFKDGTGTESVDDLWSRDHSNRNPTVRSRLIYATQLWQANTSTINTEKLIKKIQAFDLSPEQQSAYDAVKNSSKRVVGEVYKTDNGWTIHGFTYEGEPIAFKDGEVRQLSGDVGEDGVFRFSPDGSLLGVLQDGVVRYEGLINYNDNTVQLGDGTVREFPPATFLDSDNISYNHKTRNYTYKDDDAGYAFWNGKIAVRPDIAAFVFSRYASPELFSEGMEEDEFENIKITTGKSLDEVTNSVVAQINKNGEVVSSGYAALGLADNELLKLSGYDMTMTRDGLPADYHNKSITEKPIYFKNTSGNISYLHKGKTKTAGAGFGMEEGTNRITYEGKPVNDPTNLFNSDAANMLSTTSPLRHVPFFNKDGDYEMHVKVPGADGWTYSPNFGMYYRSPDSPDNFWIASQDDSQKGSWMYSGDDSFFSEGTRAFYDYGSDSWTFSKDGEWKDAVTGQSYVRSFSDMGTDGASAPSDKPTESFREGMKLNPTQTLEFRDSNGNGIEDREEGIYYEKDLIPDDDTEANPVNLREFELETEGNPVPLREFKPDEEEDEDEDETRYLSPIEDKPGFYLRENPKSGDNDIVKIARGGGGFVTVAPDDPDFVNAGTETTTNPVKPRYYDDDYDDEDDAESNAKDAESNAKGLAEKEVDELTLLDPPPATPVYFDRAGDAWGLYDISGKLIQGGLGEDNLRGLPSLPKPVERPEMEYNPVKNEIVEKDPVEPPETEDKKVDKSTGVAGYIPIDLSDAKFIPDEEEEGNYRLINVKFTGDELRGQDALDAAKADADKLARLHATAYRGPDAGQRVFEKFIDKIFGPNNNPLRLLRKFGGAEDIVDAAAAYEKASNAATMESVKNQNLATYVGEGRIAGKPPLFVDGTIEQQAAPFLQRKYIVDQETGIRYLNPDYDPNLSDYIYTAGPDGTLGTDDDIEQMWSPSWLLPWQMRQQEAELRTEYGNSYGDAVDYYYKPTFDSDGDGVADQSLSERNQAKAKTQLESMGIYGDPNKVYYKMGPNGMMMGFVTGDGVDVLADGEPFLDPSKLDPSLTFTGEVYKAPLVNELAEEAFAFQYGGPDDTRSKEYRNKALLDTEDYYRQLGDELETLDYADRQKRNALLYNTVADTSRIAKAREDAVNNTAKAKLFGGKGITPGSFTTPTPAEGKNYFGYDVPDLVKNPYEVIIGKNKINLLDKSLIGKSPEEVVTAMGGTNPVKPNNIFMNDPAETTSTSQDQD